MEIKLSKNNDYGVSHGVECSQEGDRIPLWRAIDKRFIIIIIFNTPGSKETRGQKLS